MKKDLKSKSKYLSLILRHDPSAGSIELDKNGWAYISDITRNTNISLKELMMIVDSDDKQRYALTQDLMKIRANQGHSIKEVEIDFDMIVPPEFLYHGTVQKYISSIMNTGLSRQSRNYLHLSKDVETATGVGSRRGSPVILKIHALNLHKNGGVFYISKNGVYLIESVPSEFISIMYNIFDKNV